MIVFVLCVGVRGLYLPWTVPNDFKNGDVVSLVANSLRSSVRAIPLDFAAEGVFCSLSNHTDMRTNIGEFLVGDSIQQTPISLTIGQNAECVSICKKKYTQEQKNYLMKLIDTNYRMSLTLDGIPCSRFETYTSGREKYRIRSPGYDIGTVQGNGKHFVSNHVTFRVKLSPAAKGVVRIVGFDIDSAENTGSKCNVKEQRSLEDWDEIEYTYSVKYEMSDLSWYKRWNDILSIDYNPKIHWFSLVNTLLLLFCMTILVVVVLVQTLRKDINKLTQTILDDETPEETGWKLVHGDVFRPPRHPEIICAIVGSGLQLVIASLIVIGIAAIGFLAPLNTGSMVTSIAVIFVVVAPFGGGFAGKMFRTIGSGSSLRNYFVSALFFVGPVLLLYLLANVVLSVNGSPAALTMKVVSELFIMIGVLDLGLFGLGYLVGLQMSPFHCTARVNSIERAVPKQPFFLSIWFTGLVCGTTIFAAIYVQVYFIFLSFWTNLTYYYLFGLLLIVLIAMLLLSCEISVFVTYLNLSYENHRWWWRAFYAPASVSIVCFLYSLYFMGAIYHPADLSSIIIFILMSFGTLIVLALGNGCVGFIASFAFVQGIYGALKME